MRTGTHYVQFELDESADGPLGTLGVNAKADIDAALCPECGRVRLYADAGSGLS